MHSSFFSRLLVAVLACFVLSYSIYMGVRFLSPDYQMETAFSYAVADSVRIRAVAVREESVITSPQRGVYAYLCSDGDVVLASSTVANVYQNSADLAREEQCRRWENEIALLQTAQSGGRQAVLSDAVSADIAGAAGALSDAAVRGDLSQLSAQRDRLQLLLSRRLITSGKSGDFSARISELRGRIDSARAQMSAAEPVRSGAAGYFCSAADGYEALLTPDWETLTADDVRGVAEGTAAPRRDPDAIGKVQKDYRWYLAAALDPEEAAAFREGDSVALDFGVAGATDVPASVKLVREEEGKTLVVLCCERLSGYLIRLRTASVDVKFRSYSGLRVSKEAIRYVGQTEGVYVRAGNLVVFKPIERVYEDETSVLCAEGSGLERFDEVIVRGKDLYDGKILQ